MPFKMTCEPDDYEGPWPRGGAMTIDEAREFFKFLNGEVPWNGTWFGEYAPGERGAYWWRKHLKDALESLIAAAGAPVQQAGPAKPSPWPVEPDRLVPFVDLQWAWANADQGAQAGAIIRCLVNEARVLRERVGHTPAAVPQRLDMESAVASTACPYLAFPDHVCNKCGRVHGYSRPQQAEPRIVFHLHEPVMTIEVEQDADGRYSVTVPTEFPGLPVGKHALYLHPPPDEVQRLRDSASALCGALTASELNDRAYHALNKLHRALEGK